MNREQIVDRLCRLAADRGDVDAEELTVDTHLFNDLNFDSLDAVEYVMEIEEEFDVSISDEQAEKVKTIGQAADLLSLLLC